MSTQILISQIGLSLATTERLVSLKPFLTPSVALNLGLGVYHLMAGLLLGIVKYYQIHTSKSYTAHPYISTAHRASLMYGFASAQLAGVALFSAWSERTNVIATISTQIFFATAVIMYATHGLLRDTTNQFKEPHKLGEKWTLPPWLIKLFMASLISAEVGGCGVLGAGMLKTIADVFFPSQSSSLQ
ncbi:hypothetical protein BGX28_005105 [Mortierella sp. GBA30]|nr:hypothetical protein BGX28_005105 [Mortierella sp. GBA30]